MIYDVCAIYPHHDDHYLYGSLAAFLSCLDYDNVGIDCLIWTLVQWDRTRCSYPPDNFFCGYYKCIKQNESHGARNATTRRQHVTLVPNAWEAQLLVVEFTTVLPLLSFLGSFALPLVFLVALFKLSSWLKSST